MEKTIELTMKERAVLLVIRQLGDPTYQEEVKASPRGRKAANLG